ncbi:hypothetical protein [Streptomyces sp. WAC 06783]|uniref:hypothetical protein n=1 Tax=Streptomyces sp. WAC 06783 TaxID=2203211 RepID=UPI000F73EDB4|nr:hypothetical protein [Streptomyces sp. WAC 06783]
MTTRLPDPTPRALRSAQRLRNLLGRTPPPPPPPATAAHPCQDSEPPTLQAPTAPCDGQSP